MTSPPPSPNSGNRSGVTGLVLGIIGLCFCGFWVFTIPGLIFSLVGLQRQPRNAAITGTVLNGIGMVGFLIAGPLLLGMFLPALATARAAAREVRTAAHISQVHSAAEVYHLDHGQYPTSMKPLTSGAYIGPDMAKDAWGNDMQFRANGENPPTITSPGSDGAFGTDDDLYNKPDGSVEKASESS